MAFMMNERFMSYIWFNKLYYPQQVTLLGQTVEIVSTGTPNRDAGPDVFNAKVKIDGTLWAGNVEFHRQASDWHRHGHDNDPNYQPVILHVVFDGNEQIMRTDKNMQDYPIPTIVLKYPPHINLRYEKIVNSCNMCGCANDIKHIEHIHLINWLDRLVVERIEQKTELLDTILTTTKGDWQEAFYIILARSFGFKTNSDAMQTLAMATPLKCIMHHRDNLAQIEALLLGQAGFLDKLKPSTDDETTWLREYQLLSHKFGLKQINPRLFKMARMRPGGFPTMRIAQFASLLHSNDNLLTAIIEAQDINGMRKLFATTPSKYWQTHYYPGEESQPHSGMLSTKSIDILIINTVVPFIFRYGHATGQPDLADKALDILQKLPNEENYITTYFSSIGINIKTAYDSQAVIQLLRNYCEKRDCLRCHLSYHLMKTEQNH